MALQHLRSSTASKRPTPGSMSDGQLALNTAAASTGLFFKDAAGALVKAGPVHVGATAPNSTPAAGGEAGNSVGEQWLDTSGDVPSLKVWNGSVWLSEPTSLTQTTIIYVDAINGDDTNGGRRFSEPKKTIKAAVAAASAGNIIKVTPGVYQEVLPINITVANLSIVGDACRSVFVHPTTATETETIFYCNSGTYIDGFTFVGLKATGARGTNPIDSNATFGLPEYQGWVAGFYPNAIIRKSPWIENCTNFADSGIDNDNFDPNNYQGTGGDLTSAPTGGGIIVDGSVVSTSSPLRSFIVNEFTQVCLDGPGLLVCNNGYAQAVSFFGLFCHYHAKALSGGQINMEVGTTDFGRYGLIADGKSSTAIFTATANGAGTAGNVTFAVNAPTAAAGWFGQATRPAQNMLVQVGSDIYPILAASPNGTGWNVTISRPNPVDRSENLGLLNAHADAAAVSFFLRSLISTASHTFEYTGSGTNYLALPENGGVPVELNQYVNINDGRVWLTSTDHNGKFKVGDTFEVDQQTGFVSIDPSSFAVNVVSDGSPQLGGDLDVLDRRITTTLGNGNVVIDSNGTGDILLKTGSVTQVTVDGATGKVTFNNAVDLPAGSTIPGYVEDTDIGVTVQAYDADTAKTDVAQTFTAAQTFGDNVTLNAQSDLRFADADSSNYVGFQAPATVSSNVTWTLPATDGAAAQVLSTDGSGTLSWAAGGGGGATDKIEEGNTSAEVIDTGSDGRFVVTTEGTERLRVASAGEIGLSGANYGTSGQVLTSAGTGAAASWATPTGGTILYNRRPALHRGPLFTKPTATTLEVIAGAVLNGYFYAAAAAVTMGAHTDNTDMAIWQHPTTGALVSDASYTSAPAGAAGGSIVGGYHYLPSGRPTAFDNGSPTAAAEILEFSIWDLTWRPECPDPRGMACIDGRFWCDLYLCGSTSYAGTDFSAVPSSRIGLTIADNSSPPLIPSFYGGDGTTAYSLVLGNNPGSWYNFAEVAHSFGKRFMWSWEFQAAAFGAPEAGSRGSDPGTVIWERESKWGLAQATGTLLVWAIERVGIYTSGSNTNTGGRGTEFADAPRALILGGNWSNGADSGSRLAAWLSVPSAGGGSIGARFAAGHLVLG